MKDTLQPIGVAIVGLGRMGQLYNRLVAESPTAQLIALCGRDQRATDALAAEAGAAAYTSDNIDAMLANHPDIEAVIVATSEWAHVAPVLAALDAGKHVLVEKPMALSPAEAATMVQRAEAKGAHLIVAHSLRFDPRFAAAREAVATGAVGEILHLYARRNPSPAAAERVIRRFPLAYWLMPHDIDMMLWTTGSAVQKVMAYSRAGGKERADFILAVLTFANDAIGVVESSWGTPGGGRLQNELFTVRGTTGAVEVTGNENGIALYRGDGSSGNRMEYPDIGYAPVIHEQLDGVFRRLFSHFTGVVRGRYSPVVTGRDGLAAVRVAAAIDRSLVERREIELSEVE
ncbi:MAG: Gfo/Idh/MocA family oxidoreductase [Caldilineaceae bacterium]|nr:Gfo/Idh/MocA family oxidoreductase [Caldilineaceae bacterium]